MSLSAGLRRRVESWARPRAPEPLPVRLDRRRIYILPTAFGGFLVALLVTMAVGALNYNNNPALLLCLLLIGATLASLLWTQLQLSGLEIHAVHGEPVPAGRPMTLRLHAAAPAGRERRGLQVDGEGDRAVLSLDATAGDATLQLETRQRGWRTLPRLRISTSRPFGLARAWSWVWPETPVLVYPAPESSGPPLPLGGGDTAQARLHAAGDDLHHLREWRQGDARRAIAWKPSARRDALIVRELERPQGADVVLDWAGTAGLAYEDRIRRLARWVDEAERDGLRYRLDVPGRASLGPDAGATHRHACLRALALLPEAR
ncbi:DUF58 domain-containing protein [Luteimonas sp BLCC-B24]|uniref:DUF58 domain-containing protein n=1 Tax=Luteimonas sp. BLCC-B24 TaxID=3025317 RepID=UPI00234D6FCC|nr:DUF58 domain-containing protein [Luteimonas sp. BLCC-B24]MDC7805511.1 DUF58 domain-containing protein [Luteimonas sp. BLCC-B24]